jgi:hypothetical protein
MLETGTAFVVSLAKPLCRRPLGIGRRIILKTVLKE